jgi:hypothetical protein
MSTLQYRITEDVMLQIDLTNSARVDFAKNTPTNQWLDPADIDKTVWFKGPFNQRLNKTFSSPDLIPLSSLTTDNEIVYSGNMLVRQGFSWNGVFAILLVVQGMQSGNTLLSRVWQAADMTITDNSDIVLIDGAFFPYSVSFQMPKMSNEPLMASVVYVLTGDIESGGSSIGFISSYPNNIRYFEPLNSAAPLPDYVVVGVTFDNNQYIVITPSTQETNKSLQQSILDYFGFTSNIVPTTIDYLVRVGNDAVGYQNVKISNQDNAFEPVKFGFDFTPWANSGAISVYVIMEVTCNNTTLTRQINSIFPYQDNVAPFLNAVVADQELTVYPVSITKQSTVTNTVIETAPTVKVVAISQPVYVEMQKQDIIFDSKLISFSQVNVQSLLQIASSSISQQQFVASKQTSDGKFYFDLTELVAPVSGTVYQVFDSNTKLMITSGTVTTNF